MESKTVHILVADADYSVREIVCRCAAEQGWDADTAKDGIAAIKPLRRKDYNLAVLEYELPIIDGKMVVGQIGPARAMPVIFISHFSKESDRLAAFGAGGNDFLVKPFFPRELTARMKNLLRLSGQEAQSRRLLEIPGIKIDLDARRVLVDGRDTKLTPREYNLLVFLCRNPGHAFSRDHLLDTVWGSQFFGTDRTVDTHIKSLREKIAPYSCYIITLYGVGYKLKF